MAAKSRQKAGTKLYTPINQGFNLLPGEKLDRWEAARPPAYQEYRRAWETWPREHVVARVPLHLDIEATNACNLRCTMCPRTDLMEAGRFWAVASFDFDLYRRIVDEAAAAGLASLKYNFLGEPTLNPRLVDMVAHAKAAGVVDTMFNTNATLLDEDLSGRLVDAGLDKLFFSFDSPYREQYNRIRVGADYDEVLGNIRRFHEVRAARGSLSPFTRVSMVRMKDNEGEWEDFRTLFEPIVDGVAFVEYVNHFGQQRPERALGRRAKASGRFCCPQLWQRMFVHPDGVATVCCIDSVRLLQVGNVHESSVEAIWNGEPYRRLREAHAAGRYDDIPVCATCPTATAC